MSMSYHLLLSFGLTSLLYLAAMTVFPRLKLIDKPGKYQLTRSPLPYPTGIIAVIIFIALFIYTRGELTFQDKGLLICIASLAVMTIIDDIKGLPTWLRLLIQVLIGFLLFATGTRIYTITNPLGGIVKLDSLLIPNQLSIINYQLSIPGGHLPVWSGIFTIIWVMLTTNAFNWFDGIPGQVSVLTIIGSLTLGFLALSSRVDQPEIAVMAFILAGIAIASALFDFPPNKVVMGDTGAMFFGMMLGTLSIYAGGKVATAFLVLGFPLIDSILVILRRIKSGKSPFRGDLDHLHHKLLRKGWSERKIILLTAILGSAFGVTALFLSTFQKAAAILLLFLVILLLTRYARPKPLQRD